MKQLPVREAYYRPRQATVLRRKAARLRAWGAFFLELGEYPYTFLVWLAILFFVAGGGGLACFTTLLAFCFRIARPASVWTRRTAARYQSQADRLEAEHRARYGDTSHAPEPVGGAGS